jgi:DNA-binding transcriptional regulator YiaG
MPNIAQLLRTEIQRLSNKSLRQHIAPLKSSAATTRKQLASLRQQVENLERELKRLNRGMAKARPVEDEGPATRVRFSAKGMGSMRQRLDLSAQDFGRLVGVSGQTIYSWEHGHSLPRAAQKTALATLRGIGKREARSRLAALGAGGADEAAAS